MLGVLQMELGQAVRDARLVGLGWHAELEILEQRMQRLQVLESVGLGTVPTVYRSLETFERHLETNAHRAEHPVFEELSWG